ncbi:hypothetical protein [Thiothrix subterranea]|uniref:hypothetical protein n=1 Tax=Thiothrix subterranea TaxID=2735563 RepID=UPI00280A5E1C|nr:hypothetical protein [Thiothrix subterranea]
MHRDGLALRIQALPEGPRSELSGLAKDALVDADFSVPADFSVFEPANAPPPTAAPAPAAPAAPATAPTAQ